MNNQGGKNLVESYLVIKVGDMYLEKIAMYSDRKREKKSFEL